MTETIQKIKELEIKIQNSKNTGEIFFFQHEMNKMFSLLGKQYYDNLNYQSI